VLLLHPSLSGVYSLSLCCYFLFLCVFILCADVGYLFLLFLSFHVLCVFDLVWVTYFLLVYIFFFIFCASVGYLFPTCVVMSFFILCAGVVYLFLLFFSFHVLCFFDLVWVTYFLLFLGEQKMVQRLQQVVAEYDDRTWKMDLVPRISYDRGLMRKDGAPNRMFLTFFLRHQELSIQFLKELGLIRSKVQCNICERDMTWTVVPHRTDGFRWPCRKSVARVRCRGTASIRHGSWFQLSNLTLL